MSRKAARSRRSGRIPEIKCWRNGKLFLKELEEIKIHFAFLSKRREFESKKRPKSIPHIDCELPDVTTTKALLNVLLLSWRRHPELVGRRIERPFI